MTEEQKAKIEAARVANSKRRADSRIEFGEYFVERMDHDNYVVAKNGGENHYFSELDDALRRLLREKISEKHKNGISGLLKAIKQAETEILGVLATK